MERGGGATADQRADGDPRGFLGYDDWFRHGMALHDWHRERGLEIFDRWSAQSDKYPGREAIERKWISFGRPYDGLRTTIASIYADARARGWKDDDCVSSRVNGVEALSGVLPEALTANPIKFKDLGKGGKILATCTNALIAIQGIGLCCTYDTFHEKMMVGGQQLGEWAGEMSDSLTHLLRIMICDRYGFDPGSQSTYDAAVQEALMHAYDPICDYLAALQWDGQPRLRTWLHYYMGADDTPLNCWIGGLSLTAAVRRARQPGYKFDQITVLEGVEGQGKSRQSRSSPAPAISATRRSSRSTTRRNRSRSREYGSTRSRTSPACTGRT